MAAPSAQADQGTGRAKVTRDQANVNKNDLIQILRALRNKVTVPPALAVASTTTIIKTTTTTYYTISGLLYTLAATDNIDVVTGAGLSNTSATQFCKLRVEVDSGGTVTVKQGGMASAQPLAKYPPRSASKATLGVIEIPASFTFGTTAFTGLVFTDGDPDLDALALEA